MDFLVIFLELSDSLFFKRFFGIVNYLIYIYIYFFLDIFGLFSKIPRLVLKVTEVTTEHQKRPKIGLNSIKKKALAEALRRS